MLSSRPRAKGAPHWHFAGFASVPAWRGGDLWSVLRLSGECASSAPVAAVRAPRTRTSASRWHRRGRRPPTSTARRRIQPSALPPVRGAAGREDPARGAVGPSLRDLRQRSGGRAPEPAGRPSHHADPFHESFVGCPSGPADALRPSRPGRQPADDCHSRRRERLRREAGGESSGEEVRSPGSAVRAADASRRALGGFAARGSDVDGPASDLIAKPRDPIPSLPG